ncbi:DEAD/DEAH box helicase [Aporhodopirellula aestuarii]|uniref:DEAD/DEAH box helicase n=1 Tax=Aporhodopirellula aestuarii TaxID=2950107 RepID=A0ABT0TZK2_9BACT|nr:DEAD/DEAH box helicase [Aporhodopirellula aestuarii]MCM2370005.1 DEAD/DEAH box helicase [Aporhodopirellula aestuarii]
MKTFESIDLFEPLKRALADQDYTTPTPIQAQAIPPAVAGQDILGCAQTGTGKTAAFALPILDFLGHEKPRAAPNRPTTLVLAPTRELAIQIGDSFRRYGKHMKFHSALVYGGVGQAGQVSSLRRGVDVLIATPGRLIDLMDQGHVSLRDVQIFVLDEADRMLDMGFLPALKKIIAALPSQRQSMFFSATLAPKIRELANSLLFNPVSINVTPKKTSVELIEQRLRIVRRENKVSSLTELLLGKDVTRSIVFTRTKHGANALVKKLDKSGIQAVAIHGNKTQNARQKALHAFRSDQINVLVATDVAARGIDIDGVSHVINYDMPVEPESYVHRIGRTGRAGADGIAISFCTGDERGELHAIESLIGQKLKIENPEERFEAPSGAPKSRGGGGGGGGRGRGRSGGGERSGGGPSRGRSGGSSSNHSFGRNKKPGRHASAR